MPENEVQRFHVNAVQVAVPSMVLLLVQHDWFGTIIRQQIVNILF